MTEENKSAQGDEPKATKINYPGNSQKSREAKSAPKEESAGRQKLEKVTSGEVVARKKPLSKRIAETFTGDDAQSVGNFLLFDVMVPAFKNLISDLVTQGIERTLFGEVKSRSRIPSGRTSYGNYYNSKPVQSNVLGRAGEPDRPTISRSSRATNDFNEIILETRGEAEVVLERMDDVVREFGLVTVADLYDLLGVSSDFTANKLGWDDLRSAHVRGVRGGFLLELPQPKAID